MHVSVYHHDPVRGRPDRDAASVSGKIAFGMIVVRQAFLGHTAGAAVTHLASLHDCTPVFATGVTCRHLLFHAKSVKTSNTHHRSTRREHRRPAAPSMMCDDRGVKAADLADT